jgi:hypothetical protein
MGEDLQSETSVWWGQLYQQFSVSRSFFAKAWTNAENGVSREDHNTVYELTLTEMTTLWLGEVFLTRRMTVWPDPRDLLMAGHKLYLHYLVGWCSDSMDQRYIQCAYLENPNSFLIEELTSGRVDGYLKREFSSHGEHVFSANTPFASAKLQAALHREEATYNWASEEFSRPSWFLEPFIPGLKYLGEIRVFVVNGSIFKSIVTTPREAGQPLEITEPTIMTPLSRLRYDSSSFGS